MNRIKEVLEEQGRSQRWLADKLSKSYNMVNAYVQNRQQPRLEILYKIAELLAVDIKDLLISNKESKNKYDITINFARKKSSKVKNSAGKTTRYNVNINMGMTFKNINNLNTFNKSFVGSGDYDVLTGHAQTINNEKNAYKVIVNQISDDIKNFIKFSLKNK